MQPQPTAPPVAKKPPEPVVQSASTSKRPVEPPRPSVPQKNASDSTKGEQAKVPSEKSETKNCDMNEQPTAAVPAVTAPVGTIVRIAGLKAQPQLNGLLGLVLRPGDGPAPERTVVRTRVGEKALKHANLQVGFGAVCPRLVSAAAGLLFTATVIAVVDVLRSGGHSQTSAAIPVLTATWAFATIGLCGWFYLPCRPSGTWLPSLSALGQAQPARHVFRGGFLLMALLLATTAWLYSDLVVPRLAEAVEQAPSPSPSPPPPRPVAEGAIETAHETVGEHDDEDERESAAQSREPTEDETENQTEGNATLTNITTSPPDDSMVERSVLYAWVAAAGAATQAVFIFDGRFSFFSVLHVVGALAFSMGSMQHILQATQILQSVRGEPLTSSSAWLQTVLRMRHLISSFGPLLVLALPLGAQMSSRQPVARNNMAKSMLDASGIMVTMRSMQWGTLVFNAVIIGTYACDFWVAMALP
eukprot:TRINITY_DN73943_c0_g1_i1.p1 TRINITY_DN73943_c0_g1~~TRINITY_DN73943_c0_g1_i1.p1  ORF type:complete len:473 (+),score=69.47 TRINITY_DN73943_c0_g1_i1:126-1544(+)